MNKKTIGIRIASIAFVAISGYYLNTSINTKNSNTAQIRSLKKSIISAQKTENNSSKASDTKTDYRSQQENAKSSMDFASKFVTNYLQALANASSSSDLKSINKTYLSDDAKLETSVNGGDDHEVPVYGVFGKNIDNITVTPSVPNDNGLISVFVSSSSKKNITFRATYNSNTKKIVKTETYTLTPKSGS